MKNAQRQFLARIQDMFRMEHIVSLSINIPLIVSVSTFEESCEQTASDVFGGSRSCCRNTNGRQMFTPSENLPNLHDIKGRV